MLKEKFSPEKFMEVVQQYDGINPFVRAKDEKGVVVSRQCITRWVKGQSKPTVDYWHAVEGFLVAEKSKKMTLSYFMVKAEGE